MKTFDDLLEDIFESDTVYLEEGAIPLNPFLAFALLKSKAQKALLDIKGKTLLAKEKMAAATGTTSGKGEDATVYKFTPQQKKILKEIYKKHGQEIIDEIKKFRKEILAPYSLIKRAVKKYGTVSDTEELGMTETEYERVYESGLKKIKKRGEIFQGFGKQQDRLDILNENIKNLKKLREDFKSSGTLNRTLMNKIYKEFDLDKAGFTDENISLNDLRTAYARIMFGQKQLQKASKEDDRDDNKITSIIKSQMRARRGALEDDEDTEDKVPSIFSNTSKKFSMALAKYMLRQNVREELKTKFKNNKNLYVKTYLRIIDSMINEAIEKKKNTLGSMVKGRKDLEFTEKERKIFEPKKEAPQYSDKLEDYNIKVKAEDFKGVKHIKKPEALEKAQKDIEAAIKRFERKLKSEIGEEDFKKLKQYRLINNLIAVKELKKKSDLFRSPEQIENTVSKDSSDEDSEENKEDETEENEE